jgi:hypothetical protein
MHKNLFCHNNFSYMFRPTTAIVWENGDIEKLFGIYNVVVGVYK